MNPSNANEPPQVQERLTAWTVKAWGWLRRIFTGCILVLVVLYIILSLPIVQNWAARQITAFLSAEWNTRVWIENVHIRLLEGADLYNLYLEDRSGDTLLTAKHLNVKTRHTLFTLLWRKLEINQLTIDDAQFYLRRDSGQMYHNLQFLIDYFTPAQRPEQPPFALNVYSLLLHHIRFRKVDQVRGQILEAQLREGQLFFKRFDLARKQIHASQVILTQPQFAITTTQVHPLDSLRQQQLLAQWAARRQNDTLYWVVDWQHLRLHRGTFQLHNYRKAAEARHDGSIDFNHLVINDIDASIDSFHFTNWSFAGRIESISLKEQSGFILERLAARQVHIDTQHTILNGLIVQTPNSYLSDTFSMRYRHYRSFRSFTDEVRMDARFHQARIAVSDLLYFVPALRQNAFFKKNINAIAAINGRIYGTVNRLRGRNVHLQLANATILSGNFDSRDLAVAGEQFLMLRLEQLRTRIPTLRQLIPGFRLPANFDNLGQLYFQGEFNGFFNDFVAFGDLYTSIGHAQMDMQLQVRQGRERARYSGRLNLINFDLGRFSNNPNFGKVTFRSRVYEGRGLTAETAQANLEAVIDSISFKGYRYRDLLIDGTLNRALFDGQLVIKDDHIDLSFNGEVDFTEEVPILNFEADVRKLHLLHLYLTQEDLNLSGKMRVNLQGINPKQASGTALLRQLQVTYRKKRTWIFDSLYLWTGYVRDSIRQLRLVSDVADATLEGTFNPLRLHHNLLNLWQRTHPQWAQHMGLKATPADTAHYRFDIAVYHDQYLLQLLNPKLGSVQHLKLKGFVDTQRDSLDLLLNWPTFQVGNVRLDSLTLWAHLAHKRGSFNLDVGGIVLNQKTRLSPISLLGLLYGDTLAFSLTSFNLTGFIDNMYLNGQLFPNGEFIQMQFSSSTVVLWNDLWQLTPDNYVRFGKQHFEAHNLALQSGPRSLQIRSRDARGLDLILERFDLDFINRVWRYDPLDFGGLFSLRLSIDDIFSMNHLELEVQMDSLLINGDNFGTFKLLAHSDQLKRPVFASLFLDNGHQRLSARGRYNPPTYRPLANPQLLSEQPNYLNIDLQVDRYPIRILEYWLAPAIHDTEGILSGSARFEGLPKKLEVSGAVTARDVATTVTYLNTRYFVKEHLVKISSHDIDATGAIVYDELGNTATLRGGLAHDNLRHLRLDCDLITDRFLAMRTTRTLNPLYYGTAIGGGIVRFRGPFKLAEIEVDATTGPGTHIAIPITYEQDASEVRFIKFTPPTDSTTSSSPHTSTNHSPDIRGLNLTLNLHLTPDARMELIFDERTGDILRGTGDGDVQIIVTRTGDFKMYGNYEVAEGEYLFTMMSLLLNKPFVVRPGGTITWSGDPFNANLDIQAVYKGVNTSVYNLIQEYLLIAPTEIVDLARTPTEVDLTMFLKGNLFQPEISFDISFPKIPQELRNYVDTKMRALRQDANELNRQVFGLLMLGQFLPTNYNFQLQQVADVGFNTLSEMIANQLSFYLTELVSEWVTDQGFISGIDFDFSYNTFSNQGLSQAAVSPSANEFQGRVKTYLFNDRAVFNIGANVGFNNNALPTTANQGTFVAGEFIFEYFLTQDRRLRIRAYHLSEPNIGGRRTKTGVGLSWRAEFDTLRELLKKKKKE